MRVSDKGLLEIAEHEGIVPAPYLDSVGVWTFGIGHTANAGGVDPGVMVKGMPDNIEAEIDLAIRTFRDDIPKYEKRVNDALTVPVKQHEFDALVSFDFNTGGIYKANLTKAINNGEKDAARHFMGWTKPPEIRKRRTCEMNLFKTGNYDANGDSIPVWKVDNNGKLRGITHNIHGHDLLARMGRTTPLPPAQDKLPERTSSLQTRTVRGNAVTAVGTATGGVTAISQLDGVPQIIFSVAFCVAAVAIGYVFYRRHTDFKEGRR